MRSDQRFGAGIGVFACGDAESFDSSSGLSMMLPRPNARIAPTRALPRHLVCSGLGMNVLVTYGSKRGGTAEIAERIGKTLRAKGCEVDVAPANGVRDVRKYGAVIVGGGLYAGRWFHEARHFVLRQASSLRERHVWFFSSGPLDDSARTSDIEPTPQIAQLIGYVGANGHVTFGGRLAPDAKGLIASAMAKQHAGDGRDMARVEAWAGDVAQQLAAQPAQAPRPASAFAPLPSRAAIVSLCLAAGLTAMGGGAVLVASPDGSLLQMPLWMLEHSPFHDFLVPGLLLLLVVGAGNTWSAMLHLRRSDNAPMASAVTGMGLVVWILVEIAMLRSFHPLQAAYLLLGVAITGVSFRSIRAMFPKPSGAGRELAPHH
ncbi:MAG TPA: flavodoxin domain-containing protein [Polyangiaceae bacterium]